MIMIIIGTINFISTGVNLVFPLTDPSEVMSYMEKPGLGNEDLSPAEIEKRAKAEEKRVEAEKERYRRAEYYRNLRNLITHTTMVVVAVPIYLYHWRLIGKEPKSE